MDLTAHDVTAADGTRLRVWETAPADPEEAVLFVHGGITSSRALFAPPVPGDDSYSWLVAAKAFGRAAFAMDVRGYGESDVPNAMDEPPEDNDPPVRAVDAAGDIAAVVDFVGKRFDVIHLVGYSWGTITGGTYVARGGNGSADGTDEAAVDSFTAGAPVYRSPYDFEEVLDGLGLDAALGAYMIEDRETVLARQDPEDVALFDAVWETQVGSNQGIDGEDAYRFQTGMLLDAKAACENEPVYDAGDIDVPTFVVRGTSDPTSQREDALALYDELDVPKQYAEFEGSHFLVHGPNRRALYESVDAFQNRVTR